MAGPNKDQMFQMLLDEIEDTLSDFESRCLRLDEKNARVELSALFRLAHNIKGASRVYGLNEFGTVVHALEDLIGTLREHISLIDPSVIDLLLRCHKFFMDWLQGLRLDSRFTPDSSIMLAELKSLVEGLKASPTTPTPESEEETKNHIIDQLPNISDLLKAREKPQPTEPQSTLHSGNLDLKQRISKIKKKSPVGNLKISSGKIDEIMRLIGELSIQQSILWHNHMMGNLESSVCHGAISVNQKTLKDLQDLVLGLRMQPIDSLFQRIERSARDIARELKKNVNLRITGNDVVLDKTVIEKMADPLIHLMRNAIDHGIESEDERLLQSKPNPAIIDIHAVQDSGQVTISIQDDGRGIDPVLILRKAKEKGLLKEGQKISENDLIKFIFEPGFSTKDDITEISGRGVGMDVVQECIQEIGGTIDTSTRVGNGTRFQITLPTSLEIIESLVFKIGEDHFIVPMPDIVEIIEVPEDQIKYLASGSPALNIREQLVPLENLSDYLQPLQKNKPTSAQCIAILIKLRDRTLLGFRVDQIIGQQQIVVRPLSDHLAELPGFTGAGILGNGEPALIVAMNFLGDCYLNWIGKGDVLRRSI